MINRELIRLKVVQLVYAYYQNEGKTIEVAEKELMFSLNKAFDLYEYLLTLLVEIVVAHGDAVVERWQQVGITHHDARRIALVGDWLQLRHCWRRRASAIVDGE